MATNPEDGKLWPASVEKHFIDVMIEDKRKGYMPNGQFKKGHWDPIQKEFNKRANKSYTKAQLTQKCQRLKQAHRTFSELLQRSGMGWNPITNIVTGNQAAWDQAIAANPKCRDYMKKGLRHYDLLGQLFNTGTATGHHQISSVEPCPNTDDEHELDKAFLTAGVHVDVDVEDSTEEGDPQPSPSERQASRHVDKRPLQAAATSSKKKKGDTLSEMTEAINRYTEAKLLHLQQGTVSMSQSVEQHKSGTEDNVSIRQAIDALDEHTDLDDYTHFQLTQKFLDPDIRALFVSMRPERRRRWLDFMISGL